MGELKQPIEYHFDLNSKSQPKVLCVTHTDDFETDILKVGVYQGNLKYDLLQTVITARMVMRWTHELLADNVACTLSESCDILIPIDSSAIPVRAGEMLVEVNIKSTVNDETLTLQFPLIVRVNGSILETAEITPDSRGTVPELLEAVEQELERVQGFATEAQVFEILDNALSGNRNISPTLLVDNVTDQTHNPNGDLIMYYIDSDDVRHNIFNFSPYLGTKDYNALQNRPVVTGRFGNTGVVAGLEGYINFSPDGFMVSTYQDPDKEIDIELSQNVPVCKTGSNDWAGRYDFDEITNVFARSGVFKVSPERALNVPTALEGITREGFYVFHLATMADDVSIIRYAIGYDNYALRVFMQTAALHRNNTFSYDVDYQSDWTEIGVKVSSAAVNQNGTITLTMSDGSTVTTTGQSVIGPQGPAGSDYILTAQDKSDIADLVLAELPTTQGVQYGNTGN